MTTSTHSRHQANREHLEGHGFEQEQAMALADVLDGLTADIGAKLEKTTEEMSRELEKTTEEIRGIVDSSSRELAKKMDDLRGEQAKKMDDLGGANSVTRWIAGVTAGLAGVAAAGTIAVLVFLLFAQG